MSVRINEEPGYFFWKSALKFPCILGHSSPPPSRDFRGEATERWCSVHWDRDFVPTSKGSWLGVDTPKSGLVVCSRNSWISWFFVLWEFHGLFKWNTTIDWMMDDESTCDVTLPRGLTRTILEGRGLGWDMPCGDPKWKCQQQPLRFGRKIHVNVT